MILLIDIWVGKSLKYVLLVLLGFSLSAHADADKNDKVANQVSTLERVICVFDPAGETGDITAVMKKIALGSSNDQMRFTVQSYDNDIIVRAKFKVGQCDSIVILGLMAGHYNQFTASIQALGVSNYNNIGTMLTSLYQPKHNDLYVNGDFEVTGIFPIGLTYMMSRDVRESSVESLEGRVMHVARASPGIWDMKEVLKIKPKYGNNSNFAGRFNRGEIDLLLAPLAAIEALSMNKKFATEGGIIDHPVSLMTLQMVIRHSRYPKGFGQLSRQSSLKYVSAVMDATQKYKKNLAPMMLPVSEEEKKGWAKALATLRDRMVEDELYDKRMIDAMKGFDILQ